MFGVGPSEMVLLMLVALLLYGGELPKVARSWGKSLAEFKKGLSSIQNEFNSVLYDEPHRQIPYHDPVYSHNAGTVDGYLHDDDHNTHNGSHAAASQTSASDSSIAESSEAQATVASVESERS